MKNPFEKDNSNLVVPIIIGAAAAAAIAYLFVTESGAETRNRIADSVDKGWDTLKKKIPAEKISELKDKVSDTVSSIIGSSENNNEATAQEA